MAKMTQSYSNHPVIFVCLAIVLVIASVAAYEFLYIKYAGEPVPVPDIPRKIQTVGSGPVLTYAVLGDSTAVGQGGEYEEGIAVSTACFMAKDHEVRFQNFAVSGARAVDVLREQTEQAAALRPDVVLLAVGANDVTRLTSLDDLRSAMAKIIDKLHAANPAVEIIATGAPAMGSVPRFPWPVSAIAALRTKQVNEVIIELAKEKDITFAPIAAETGPIFSRHPELFAQDLFHPNTKGYNVWVPVLNKAITAAMPGMQAEKL